ncbi:MAG: stage III sporulation protein AE [Oscillospiraceae bacterium]|jgi:stage III sporulation protein AE|nr:stage III sporulation protein AE [Oscillospiraceae bacterium]
MDTQQILTDALPKAQAAFGGAMRSAAIVLVAAILVGVARQFCSDQSAWTVDLAGVLAISFLAIGDASAFMGLGKNTLAALGDLANLVLPMLAGAAAASGTPSAAAAQFAVTALFMDALIIVAERVLQPLIFAYLAAEVAGAASGNDAMSGAAGFLKWLCTTVLSVIVLVFVIYLSVTGIVSSTADAAAVRVAKTTISAVLPVVGSIVADAASSVLAGALTLKNTIGISAMVSVLTLCMAPFLNLGAQYLMYKAASKLAAGIAGGRIARLASGIGTAFGLMLATVGACGLMLFFSLISMLSIRQ